MTRNEWDRWIESLQVLKREDLKMEYKYVKEEGQRHVINRMLYPISNLFHEGNCECGAVHYVHLQDTGWIIGSYLCLGCGNLVYDNNFNEEVADVLSKGLDYDSTGIK